MFCRKAAVFLPGSVSLHEQRNERPSSSEAELRIINKILTKERNIIMETRTIEIISSKNENIKIGIIPGHFATNHSHVNYYVDMTSLRKRFKMSMEAAKVFTEDFSGTPVDTIICLEGTQVIGAFLAQQLSESTLVSVNSGNDINVITPELDSNNQFIFRDNTQGMIWNKNVLLLISSASTGRTIERCIECLTYYSGNLAGVAALFSAIDEMNGIPVKAIYHKGDLPDYESYSPAECAMCRDKRKVDAIINDHGYSKI
ncbi:MAG: orotate phosphoribosyltransferase [Oscillospiraceae bacterium]|nr:orotate phosphoribosyltransferase [Oscillospiraceae bacterium]